MAAFAYFAAQCPTTPLIGTRESELDQGERGLRPSV